MKNYGLAAVAPEKLRRMGLSKKKQDNSTFGP
jgi:hypothetical protein